MITFNQLRAIVKNIKTNVTCPSCEENFSNDNIAVVSSARNKCAIVAQCRTCGTPILVTINIHRNGGEDSAEIMVHDESSLAANGEVPVTAGMVEPTIADEEVSAVHDFLQDFSGDFETLFAGSEKGSKGSKGGKKRRSKGSEK